MYSLYLVKPTTGQVLNGNGELLSGSEALSYETSFSSYEEALTAKDALLKQVVWGVVQIYSEAEEKETFFFNEEFRLQYVEEAEAWNSVPSSLQIVRCCGR